MKKSPQKPGSTEYGVILKKTKDKQRKIFPQDGEKPETDGDTFKIV